MAKLDSKSGRLSLESRSNPDCCVLSAWPVRQPPPASAIKAPLSLTGSCQGGYWPGLAGRLRVLPMALPVAPPQPQLPQPQALEHSGGCGRSPALANRGRGLAASSNGFFPAVPLSHRRIVQARVPAHQPACPGLSLLQLLAAGLMMGTKKWGPKCVSRTKLGCCFSEPLPGG